MSEADTAVLVCANLDMGHTPDSVQVKAGCGHQVWIAPTGMNMVLNPVMPTRTVCWRCAKKDAAAQESIRTHGLRAVPGARAELEEHLGKEETDRVYRRFNVREGLP